VKIFLVEVYMAELNEKIDTVAEINKSKHKLISIFQNEKNDYTQVVADLNEADAIFVGFVTRSETFDNAPKVVADFVSTFYHLLDYFDIKNESLNVYIESQFEKCFDSILNEKKFSLEINPKIAIAILRLLLCNANICYREQNYSKGMSFIEQIKKITELPIFKEKELEISPSFMADLFFQEARFLVRNNNFYGAKLLLIKAIKKYEEWELWENAKKESLTSKEFRDFITYKISIAQSFSLYSNILQGKIETVVRESSTIERLLDYTNHRTLKHFVQMLRAKALRLGGFQNEKQLQDAIQLLKTSRKVFEDYQNIEEFSSLSQNFKPLKYQRFYLMSLFQQGLTSIYLHDTIIGKVKKTDKKKSQKLLTDTLEVISIMRENELNEYWKIRANLLEVYHLLNAKEYEKAFKTALKNKGIKIDNNFLQIELLTAIAEVGIARVEKISKSIHSEEPVAIYDEILEEIQQALEECSDIEKDFREKGWSAQISERSNPLLKNFALYYLLQCQLHILLDDPDVAQKFWEKWNNMSDVIQFSRWQELAQSIRQTLENIENQLIIKINGCNYEEAKNALQDALFTKVNRLHRTDIEKIAELGVSRESYYKWKGRSKS
jgi:hypothetical protein